MKDAKSNKFAVERSLGNPGRAVTGGLFHDQLVIGYRVFRALLEQQPSF
jgi:hypothetical protein